MCFEIDRCVRAVRRNCDAHLWILEKGLLVVHAAALSVRRRPLSVHDRLDPRLLQREERRVDDAAHRQHLEVLAEVLERHPVTNVAQR